MKKKALINLLLMSLWVFISSECLAQWTTMEPIPTPRVQATASTLNGKIYVIGGIQEVDGSSLTTVEAYDPRTNTWDTTIADYPLPVAYASSQVVNDTLYVMGGTNREHGGDHMYKAMYAYAEDLNTWTRKRNLPYPNAYHKTVVVEDMIFMLGGSQGEMPENRCFTYTCTDNTWHKMPNLPANRGFMDVQAIDQVIYMTGGAYLGNVQRSSFQFDCDKKEWGYLPPLPEPLAFNGSGKLDNEVYVFGGLTYWDLSGSKSITSQKTWKLQIGKDTTFWMDMEEDMPIEIIGYAHAVGEDELGRQAIYFFGGASQDFYYEGAPPSPMTLKYTRAKETAWHYMEPVPTPRAMASSVHYMGKTFLIGGTISKTANALNTVEAYDIRFDRWETNLPDIPEPVCQAAAQVFGNTIYVIGGGEKYLGNAKRSVYAYDIYTKEWERKADLPSGLIGPASVVFMDHIYVAGGIGEDGNASDKVFRYQPFKDQWEVLPSLVYPRAFCGLHLDMGSGLPGYKAPPAGLIVSGGMSGEESLLDMERLDIYRIPDSTGFSCIVDTDGWRFFANMPAERFCHGAGQRDRSIFLLGGMGEEMKPLYDILKYNIPENKWTEIGEPLPENSSPFALTSIPVHENECYYAMGGPTADFWNGGNGPRVSGLNLHYCANAVGIKPITDPNVWRHLKQNYPNPFAEGTTFPITLEKAGDIRCDILDIEGKTIEILFEGFKPAGKHKFSWEAHQIPPGVYVYRLRTDEGMTVRKMIVQSTH